MNKAIHIILIILFGSFFIILIISGSFLTGESQEVFNYKTIVGESAAFSGVNQIVSKDNRMYCINRNHQILIYDMYGKYKGFFQVPFKYKKDFYEIYVYKDILCARRCGRDAEQGDIYMYDGEKYLGVIDFKNEGSLHTEATIKDSKNKEVFIGETKNYHALVFSDGKIYYDADDCIVSEQISQKEINMNRGVKFKIKGIFKKKLIQIDQSGSQKVIASESWKDFIGKTETLMCISFLICFWNGLMLQKSSRGDVQRNTNKEFLIQKNR